MCIAVCHMFSVVFQDGLSFVAKQVLCCCVLLDEHSSKSFVRSFVRSFARSFYFDSTVLHCEPDLEPRHSAAGHLRAAGNRL